MLESVVSARGKVLRTNFSATSRVTRATKLTQAASRHSYRWCNPVWSKYSNAQRISSLHLSKGCLNPPSRSDTYSSSAEGVAMDWKTMLSYISGSVDKELLRFYHWEAA